MIPTDSRQEAARKARDRIVLVLMLPFIMLVFNNSLITLALPAFRDAFRLPADVVAWLMTIFTLPFIMFMPLYGKLGDMFGGRRIFMVGIAIFTAGTLITVFAGDLGLLFFGRFIQGIGAAGIHPICLSIIADNFPVHERGKAVGTWQSVGPAAWAIGPIIGGFLIDHIGWRAIFGPILLVAFTTLLMVGKLNPGVKRSRVRTGFYRDFDWFGVTLLGALVVALVFYVSSRPITGVTPLRDMRLLAAALVCFGAFVLWERRRKNAFISLGLFSFRNFTFASLCAFVRMFIMGCIDFLIPLYLTDIHGLAAAPIGFVMMLDAAGLFATMRLGGLLADRWSSRWLIVLGSLTSAVIMVFFGFLSASSPVVLFGAAVAVRGIVAGIYAAPLYQIYMRELPEDQAGSAGGIFTMIRFGGALLGAAIAGVLLEQGLAGGLALIRAYQNVFLVVSGVGVLGFLFSLGLKEHSAGSG
ncbi:MAG TPA: MFS transporter [Spirochaetia bacterium]|nr:MFS transporter [Spirochaetia bacterium]